MARPRTRRTLETARPGRGLFRPGASVVFLLSFSLVAVLALLFLWGRVRINQLATDIAELEQQRQQVLDQNDKLRIQIERLSSYSRISRIARTRSGLVPLRPQLLIVEDE